MDIVIKNVSLYTLYLVKLGIARMIRDLEFRVDEIQNDYDSSSKYSRDFYRDLLKDKKADLDSLRNFFKHL